MMLECKQCFGTNRFDKSMLKTQDKPALNPARFAHHMYNLHEKTYQKAKFSIYMKFI